MNVRRVLFAVLLTCASVACASDDDATGAAAPPVMVQGSFAPLRDAFNAAHGSVRLLFVVDSACAVCLRGMADLDDDLLRSTHDTRLRTFVVHVPVIGGTAEHIGPSAKLLQNPNVTHYWNPSGAFGTQLGQSLALKRKDKDVYAWDVWLVYGPDATWSGTMPPAPQLLMHQLPQLRDSEYAVLDSASFAAHVRRELAQLSPPSKAAD